MANPPPAPPVHVQKIVFFPDRIEVLLLPNVNRHYDGPELQSPNFQEISRIPIIAPNYTVDRKAKLEELPQQSSVVDKVFQDPPPYEGPSRGEFSFSHGVTLDIDSNAKGSIPKLSIEYQSEPPNNIHLRIKIQNCGYWVSELEFKIRFLNGDQAIRIEGYHPSNANLETRRQIIKHKQAFGGKVGSPPGTPVTADLHGEYQREYEDVKESFISIDGLREDDHSIRWICNTVGDLVGPLKTITLKASITIPKDNNISQLTASIEARPKCVERNVLRKIGRVFKSGTAKSLIGNFTVNFKD